MHPTLSAAQLAVRRHYFSYRLLHIPHDSRAASHEQELRHHYREKAPRTVAPKALTSLSLGLSCSMLS